VVELEFATIIVDKHIDNSNNPLSTDVVHNSTTKTRSMPGKLITGAQSMGDHNNDNNNDNTVSANAGNNGTTKTRSMLGKQVHGAWAIHMCAERQA